MPEELMTLDEISAVARDGRWHAAWLSLVEHVRRLTPAPAVEPPHVCTPGPICETCGDVDRTETGSEPAPVVDPPTPIAEYDRGACAEGLPGGRFVKVYPSCRPAPVSPRAETMAPSATRAGYDLYLRWFDTSGVYHEMRYDVRSTPQATEMAHNITSMIEAAGVRSKALGFEAGRRKGLEEAARVVARFPEYDNVRNGFSGLIDRDDAAATVRSLIGGDK